MLFFHFLVWGMSTAETAILRELNTFGFFLFIFRAVVIDTLTLGAFKLYILSHRI